jgi:hypothetical protein
MCLTSWHPRTKRNKIHWYISNFGFTIQAKNKSLININSSPLLHSAVRLMLSSRVVNPNDKSSERRTTPCRPKRQLIFQNRMLFPLSESWKYVIPWWPTSCKTTAWRSGPDWTGSLHLFIIHSIVSLVYGSLQVNFCWLGSWQGGVPSHAMWRRIFLWNFFDVSERLWSISTSLHGVTF